MNCLKCDQDKPLYVKKIMEKELVGVVEKGFCRECWQDVDQSGSCFNCGADEDLFVNAVWMGRPIEHICGHCRATLG